MRERFIGAILLGNNLANIAASALATGFFLHLFGEAGIAYATLVMTAIVVLFAEVLPKTYAILIPDRMALAVAPAIRILVAVLAPITAAMQWIVRHTLRMFCARIADDAEVLSAHDELRGAINLYHKTGGMVKLTRDMLGGVLDFRTSCPSDQDGPIDAELPAKEAIVDAALKSPHTRLPLWRGEREEIVGVLHAKTLLRAARRTRRFDQDRCPRARNAAMVRAGYHQFEGPAQCLPQAQGAFRHRGGRVWGSHGSGDARRHHRGDRGRDQRRDRYRVQSGPAASRRLADRRWRRSDS
jgi:Mg2+/Co2+ transporter CorB